MARIQNKTCGSRAKRERLDAEHVRESINAAIEKKGLTLPRFGQMDSRGKRGPRSVELPSPAPCQDPPQFSSSL